MEQELPWGESPIDLEGDERTEAEATTPQLGGLGWSAIVAGAGSALLLAFNSHAIANWANQLPITSATAPVYAAAHGWQDATGRLGLNAPVEAVERAAEWLRDLGSDSEPAEPPAPS